jgi:hypothetical protein
MLRGWSCRMMEYERRGGKVILCIPCNDFFMITASHTRVCIKQHSFANFRPGSKFHSMLAAPSLPKPRNMLQLVHHIS